MRALDRAMKQKLHSLTLKMLEKTSPKAGLLEQMLDEAEKGERQMEEFDAKATYAALRERLGLGKPLPSAATAPSGSNQPKEPEATKPKPKKPKPGTTKPDRKESFAARKAILAKRASKK
jgi:hypothetical protein